jgi:predicted nucleotidyltransferase component of viral defense system
MHDVVKHMLEKYPCHSQQDYTNALKEIFQEIALLGLWRAKFFEKAAFYGGSALRILYGLNRFSEDLDFSLLAEDKNFSLEPYNKAVTRELLAFGFEASVDTKVKAKKTDIESAFIKANAKKQFIAIETPLNIINDVHRMQTIKIKMEVDTTPPGLFNTETKFLLQPIPFSVKSFTPTCLFSGKIHALLCRPWIHRVKGRDWYDFIWFISRNISVNLPHLQQRLEQSGAQEEGEPFSKDILLELLKTTIQRTDFDKAKADISPFIKDTSSLNIWSETFFLSLLDQLTTVD